LVDDAVRNSETDAEEEQAEGPGLDPVEVAGFEAAIAANYDEMARVAFVVTGTIRPAHEAVQAAWVDAWRGRNTERPPERLRDWLLGLATVEARLRAEGGAQTDQEEGLAGSGVAATQASAAAAYRSDELELANALASLDIHDRMIVALTYIGGLNALEIGRELNMPERSVLARNARLLKTFIGESRLAEMPSATVDDYSRALAQRIRALTGRAVIPLDPAEVAKGAIEAPPATTWVDQLEALVNLLIERLREVDLRVWLGVGGVALILLIVPRLFSGFGGSPAATAVPSDATTACRAIELDAAITAWEPLASDWLATVDLRNVSDNACLIDNLPEPWLYDQVRTQLLIGKDVQSSLIRIGPGDVMRTRVQVHNYCGPAAAYPIRIAFRDGTLLTVAASLPGDTHSGVPTCVDSKSAGSITMSPWSPAPRT
jgi:DNA-directed RNA polymerase specialized sigma24 family protein